MSNDQRRAERDFCQAIICADLTVDQIHAIMTLYIGIRNGEIARINPNKSEEK